MVEWFVQLMRNRAGTRVGRATWVYFALWALLMIVIDVMRDSLSEAQVMWLLLTFALVSPFILLLNRRDLSGPTREELDRAALIRNVAELANRRSTLSYRLGRWIGKRRH